MRQAEADVKRTDHEPEKPALREESETGRLDTHHSQRKMELEAKQKQLRYATQREAIAELSVKEKTEAFEAGKRKLDLAKQTASELRDLLEESEGLTALNALMGNPDMRAAGTVILRTDRMDLSAEAIFRLYRQSHVAKEYFRICDDISGLDASYMKYGSGVEAWLFLNHLAATMTAAAIQNADQTRPVPFQGMMELLCAIRSSADEPTEPVSSMERSILDACRSLESDPGVLPII